MEILRPPFKTMGAHFRLFWDHFRGTIWGHFGTILACPAGCSDNVHRLARCWAYKLGFHGILRAPTASAGYALAMSEEFAGTYGRYGHVRAYWP